VGARRYSHADKPKVAQSGNLGLWDLAPSGHRVDSCKFVESCGKVN